MSSTPQYVDISAVQGTIDWHAYRAWAASFDGISRVAMKSSEGTGFTDARFREYRAAALAAGIDVIIYYHYARPDLNVSAASEAAWQRQVVGAIRPHDRLMLDYEQQAPAATAAWALTWLNAQAQAYGAGQLPLFYSYEAFIKEHLQDQRLAAYPLVLALWQYTPDERPACPAPWTHYDYLQYSDKATNIPGIPGPVDADIYLGTEDPPSMIIDPSTNPTVAAYFTAIDAHHWHCSNGFMIQDGILDFYRSFANTGLCGLTHLGLPRSNETPIEQISPIYAKLTGKGVVIQRFERADVLYDPGRMVDNPPGSGPIYLAHIDQLPGLDPRLAAIATARADISACAKLIGDTATHILATSNQLGN